MSIEVLWFVGKYKLGGVIVYYSNGNYEAFARPEKPEGVDKKSAYIVGSGLAGLAVAAFLIRDAQMPGSHIHIFEADPVSGGACDGAFLDKYGFVCRGGREMEKPFRVSVGSVPLRSLP